MNASRAGHRAGNVGAVRYPARGERGAARGSPQSKKYDLRHLDDYEPTALELLEGHERERAAAAATAGLPTHLNETGREWLEHFVRDFSQHGEINPSRVADGGKSRAVDGGQMHRASATRALQSIQKELVAQGVAEAPDLPDPATRAARRPIVQPRRRPRD